MSYFAAANFCVQAEDISPREFSAANVTCVAFGSIGAIVPEKINFTRTTLDKLGNSHEHELTANEALYFTNRTENYGRWIIT